MDASDRSAPDLGGWVRRLRRVAGLSQRGLATASGVTASTVGRVEAGSSGLSVGQLARIAAVAGARVALLDEAGAELLPMRRDAVRDRGDRRFPAHVDVLTTDDRHWEVLQRETEQPWYCFHRGLPAQDEDHRAPRRDDDPLQRRRERRAARARAEHEEWQRRLAAGLLERAVEEPCTCPAGCDELLLAEHALPAAVQRVPHVDPCACRCDLG